MTLVVLVWNFRVIVWIMACRFMLELVFSLVLPQVVHASSEVMLALHHFALFVSSIAAVVMSAVSQMWLSWTKWLRWDISDGWKHLCWLVVVWNGVRIVLGNWIEWIVMLNCFTILKVVI